MLKFRDDVNVEYPFAKKIYTLILVFSFCWLVLIFLAPVFLMWGGSFEKISTYIYLFFSKVCHQNDNRSFHVLEHKLGVCSRCVSVYTGFFVGTLLYPLKNKFNNINAPSVVYLLVPILLLFTDVILDSLGIMTNTFLTRSLTGLLLGVTLPLFIIPGFVRFFYEVHSYLRNKVSI